MLSPLWRNSREYFRKPIWSDPNLEFEKHPVEDCLRVGPIQVQFRSLDLVCQSLLDQNQTMCARSHVDVLNHVSVLQGWTTPRQISWLLFTLVCAGFLYFLIWWY